LLRARCSPGSNLVIELRRGLAIQQGHGMIAGQGSMPLV
jgi:hypothetical protein